MGVSSLLQGFLPRFDRNSQLSVPEIDTKDFIVLVNNPGWVQNFTIVNASTDYLPRGNGLILLAGENGQLKESEQERAFHQFQKLVLTTPGKFVLVQGKCDYQIPSHFVEQLPDSVKAIYSNAVCDPVRKLHYLPMGRDFRSMEVYLSTDYTRIIKDWLCYCNFSLNTYGPRQKIYELIKKKDFIHFDMGQRFLNYTISREQFYYRLARSKFTITPRGNGADSFRFWDCLYLGTVPITVRESYHQQFEGELPMLLLESDEDYKKLTRRFLEKKYREICSKKYNYNLLKLSYWLKKIRNKISERKFLSGS